MLLWLLLEFGKDRNEQQLSCKREELKDIVASHSETSNSLTETENEPSFGFSTFLWSLIALSVGPFPWQFHEHYGMILFQRLPFLIPGCRCGSVCQLIEFFCVLKI